MDTYITTREQEEVDAGTAAVIAGLATSPVVEVMRALQGKDGHLTEASLRALAADRLVSLSRLYSLAVTDSSFTLDASGEAGPPQSEPVPLPVALAAGSDSFTTLVQGGPLTSRFDAPPESLEAYRSSGGMKAWEKASGSLGPEKVFAEIVLGPITRQPDAWQDAAAAEGDTVIVANCHGGDPLALQEDALLAKDPYAIIEGMLLSALALGASRGFIFTRPLPEGRKDSLAAIADEMTAASGLAFDIEVIEGPDSLVASESSVAVAVIDGRRPVSSVIDHAVTGIWRQPTLVDTGECFAAITAVIASGEQVATRLYQLSGAVESVGIIEAEASSSVRDLMEIAGARPGAEALVGGLSGRFLTEGEVDQEMLHLKPAIGPRWRLIHVLGDPRDIYPMAVQIAAYNARYLCGTCVPCRIGSVRMAEIIAEYLVGFDTLEELAETLEQTGLCLAGRGAAAMVTSALRYVS